MAAAVIVEVEEVSYFLNIQSGVSSGIIRETRIKFGVRQRDIFKLT